MIEVAGNVLFYSNMNIRGKRSDAVFAVSVIYGEKNFFYFNKMHETAKGVYCVSYICLYFRSHAVTPLPLDGFSSKLIFEYFCTICTENINFFKI